MAGGWRSGGWDWWGVLIRAGGVVRQTEPSSGTAGWESVTGDRRHHTMTRRTGETRPDTRGQETDIRRLVGGQSQENDRSLHSYITYKLKTEDILHFISSGLTLATVCSLH